MSFRGWCGIAAGLAIVLAASGCRPRSAAPPDVRSADLSYAQGFIAYSDGDRAAAEQFLRAAIGEDPDLIMARGLLGDIYREKKEYESAVVEYERVTELDPYVADNHYKLGLVQHLLDRLQEAAASYLRALDLNPDDPKPNMNLGLVYLMLGRQELGLTYAKKAADLAPESAEAQANYGVLLDANGQWSAAEKAYRRAMELGGNQPQIMANLAANLSAQGNTRQAIALYDQLLKSDDRPALRERYGVALMRAGRIDDAAAQFHAVLKDNPNRLVALNGLAEARLTEYRKGASLDEAKLAEAVRYWKRSLAINPDQPRIAGLVKEYESGSLFGP